MGSYFSNNALYSDTDTVTISYKQTNTWEELFESSQRSSKVDEVDDEWDEALLLTLPFLRFRFAFLEVDSNHPSPDRE